jgi:hypothetical protein
VKQYEAIESVPTIKSHTQLKKNVIENGSNVHVES